MVAQDIAHRFPQKGPTPPQSDTALSSLYIALRRFYDKAPAPGRIAVQLESGSAPFGGLPLVINIARRGRPKEPATANAPFCPSSSTVSVSLFGAPSKAPFRTKRRDDGR